MPKLYLLLGMRLTKTQIARNHGLIGILDKPTNAEKIIDLIKANNC